MTLGERIKAIRKEKGMTQKQLSERCGIAEPTIRGYESGRLNPKVETLRKLADGLEYPLAKLMQMDTEETGYTFETLDAGEFFRNFPDSSGKSGLTELLGGDATPTKDGTSHIEQSKGSKNSGKDVAIRISKAELANMAMRNIHGVFISDAESGEFLRILSEMNRDEALQMLQYGQFLMAQREQAELKNRYESKLDEIRGFIETMQSPEHQGNLDSSEKEKLLELIEQAQRKHF